MCWLTVNSPLSECYVLNRWTDKSALIRNEGIKFHFNRLAAKSCFSKKKTQNHLKLRESYDLISFFNHLLSQLRLWSQSFCYCYYRYCSWCGTTTVTASKQDLSDFIIDQSRVCVIVSVWLCECVSGWRVSRSLSGGLWFWWILEQQSSSVPT